MTSKQAAELYRRAGHKPPMELADAQQMREHKYNATKKEVSGILFDSALEAETYRILQVWRSAGVIGEVHRQVPYILKPGFRDSAGKWHRAIKFVVDFSYYTPYPGDPHWTCIDSKGFPTPAFRIKEKLFRAAYPDIDLQIWDRAKVKELARL